VASLGAMSYPNDRNKALELANDRANDRANNTSWAAGRDALWVVERAAAGGGLKLYAESWTLRTQGGLRAVV
jgi:hypothetical protein